MPPPLNGVTIVDFSRILSGPYATMILADLGAAVIKVERPGKGDDARRLPPLKDGKSAYFAAVNRGKRSIALDLDVEADRALLDRIDAVKDNAGALELIRPELHIRQSTSPVKERA